MSSQYINFLKKYLVHNPDALLWCLSFTTFCHLIDDYVDGEKDNEHFLKIIEFTPLLYTNIFFQQNWQLLYPLIKSVTNDYQDSVILEKSNMKWKRQVADGLRQNGNAIILMVIEIANNIDIRRQASLELREISYKTHHNMLTLQPT